MNDLYSEEKGDPLSFEKHPDCTGEVAIQVGLPPQKKAQGPSVAMVYYSTYGHVKQLAEEIKRGIWAFF